MSGAGASAGAAGAGAAAYAAYIGNAVKAAGSIVKLEAATFTSLMARLEAPLIVHAKAFPRKHVYVMPYRGLCLHTKVSAPLELPADAEVLEARKVWLPH